MALTAHLLGYHLAPNFDMPFLSANMAESSAPLVQVSSSWIRDYVHPHGRQSRFDKADHRNILVTTTLREACGTGQPGTM